MSDEQSLICILTPPGVGAIATLAVRGARVWEITSELFRPFGAERLPADAVYGQFWPGRLGGEAADVVILAVKNIAPLPSLEIHCHGGAEVVRMLTDTYASRSVRLCTWQEFDEAFGEPAWKIAAKQVLLQAPTVRTAGIALDQYHGAYERAIESIQEGLARNESAAHAARDRLTRFVELGRHLAMPFRVGIAGAPNVGKSSLINALAGYARSIVSPTPGTTRDVVTTRVALDGWPVELFDTAGLRSDGEAIEREGMRLATASLFEADLVIWMLDGSDTLIDTSILSRSERSTLKENWRRMLTVINKIDLPAAWNWDDVVACRVSALTGTGVGELCQRIAGILVPEAPLPGEAVPIRGENRDGTA